VKDQLAGKQARCKCGVVLTIPAVKPAQAPIEAELADDPLGAAMFPAPPSPSFPSYPSAMMSQAPMSSPYASPQAWSAAPARGSGQFAGCPNCRQQNAKRIAWTLWGGLIGPLILCHVKCLSCGTTYNGRTGRSNQTAIIIRLVAPLIVVAICLAMGLVLGVVGALAGS
jgi:hypothetical protein